MSIIETGLLRFAVPEAATDDSLYRFSLADESVTVDRGPAQGVVSPEQWILSRIDPVRAWATETSAPQDASLTVEPVNIPGLANAVHVTLSAPGLDRLDQRYLAGAIASLGQMVCLRYSGRRSDAASDTADLIMRSICVGRLPQPAPAGWTGRSALGLSFVLPKAFDAPRGLEFTLGPALLSLSHGLPHSPWNPRFSADDAVETLQLQTATRPAGRTGRSFIETIRRVRHTRPAIVVEGRAVRAATVTELTVRETHLDDMAGRTLRCFGSSSLEDDGALDALWDVMTSSLEATT